MKAAAITGAERAPWFKEAFENAHRAHRAGTQKNVTKL